MGRPPSIPAEQKTGIVMSVLAGEMSVAEAARTEKLSEQSIGRWKADFLEAGKTALVAGVLGRRLGGGEQLEAELISSTGRWMASGHAAATGDEYCRGESAVGHLLAQHARRSAELRDDDAGRTAGLPAGGRGAEQSR